MRTPSLVLVGLIAFAAGSAWAGLDPKNPTWWEKYQYIQNGSRAARTTSTTSR